MSDQPFKRITTEVLGHTITVEWYYDHDMGPPWEEHDGHGPVSEWTRRSKRPGERVLHRHRFTARYYDFAAAVKIARKEKWDAPPYKTGTPGEQAVRAVEADFEHLRRWVNERWWWCGYTAEARDATGKLIWNDALWGIESNEIDHFTGEVTSTARDFIQTEVAEKEDAACRGIVTV